MAAAERRIGRTSPFRANGTGRKSTATKPPKANKRNRGGDKNNGSFPAKKTQPESLAGRRGNSWDFAGIPPHAPWGGRKKEPRTFSLQRAVEKTWKRMHRCASEGAGGREKDPVRGEREEKRERSGKSEGLRGRGIRGEGEIAWHRHRIHESLSCQERLIILPPLRGSAARLFFCMQNITSSGR